MGAATGYSRLSRPRQTTSGRAGAEWSHSRTSRAFHNLWVETVRADRSRQRWGWRRTATGRDVRARYPGCRGNEGPRSCPVVRLQILQQGCRRVQDSTEASDLSPRIPRRQEECEGTAEGPDHRTLHTSRLVLQRPLLRRTNQPESQEAEAGGKERVPTRLRRTSDTARDPRPSRCWG